MKIHKIDKTKGNGIYILLAVGLITFAVFGRLLPHEPNFAPVAAVAIFGGVILPRRLALSVPLLAMIISDLFIGLHSLFLLTWVSFAVIALLGNYVVKAVKPSVVVGASLGASVFFYLVSNFGVWLEGRMYSMTFSGLLDCYYQAIPFFRNTLLGDMVFTTLLFGAYALVSSLVIVSRMNRLALRS